jgi:hypothetical protein
MKLVIVLSASLAFCHAAMGAAIDDIHVQISQEHCQGFAAGDQAFVVYAANSNPTRTIAARFKYDSVPSRQHFILFDAGLNPDTDRFPKSISRHLGPLETAPIGCSATRRAAPTIRDSQTVPLVTAKDGAAYVEAGDAQPGEPAAGSYLAFYLQSGVGGCSAGSKPPGLFYAVNLHPFARFSGSLELLDEHGNKSGAMALDLAPLASMKVGCSNGSPKPGSVANLSLDIPAVAVINQPLAAAPVAKTQPPAEPRESLEPRAAPQSAPLPLETIQRTQNVCAGSVPPGWIKINDTWNPTVCGKPASIVNNVWTLQQLTDQPVGTVIYACSGAPPAGWAVVGQMWNPTVCGHPSVQQPNIMAIKRLN